VDCLDINNQFNFPDLTTPQTLAVQWTGQEYTEILSALSMGAFLVYGENAVQVIEQFLKIVGCPVDICSEVANCIANSPEVQAALGQYLADSGIQPTAGDNPPVPISAPQSASQLLPDGYTCDNDHLFGMARWIVQQLDLSTRQVLAAIEILTNQVELAAVFVDNVEGVSWVGSGVELAAWLQDQLIEWYDAAYTPTVEDTLACEIFCLIKDDCTLTLDKIISAYSNNSFGVPTDLNDWMSVLDWLVNTTFDGSIGTVASYHYFIAQALRFGSTLPIFDGLRGLRMIVQMGEDEVDSDWNILCNCPVGTWCYQLDLSQFAAYDFSSTTNNTAGMFNSPQWDASDAIGAGAGVVKGIFIELDLGMTVSISEVRNVGNAVEGTGTFGTDYAARVQLLNGASVDYDSGSVGSPAFGAYDQTFTPGSPVSADKVRFLQQIDNRTGQPTDGSGSLTVYELHGTGTNPFGSDNC